MASDSAHRWRAVAALFDAAVRLPRDARQFYLDEACGEDTDLRRRVADLLEASDRASGFMDRPFDSRAAFLLGEVADRLRAPSTFVPGDAIGPYRLVARVAEGGMGEVWRAEQTSPLHRRVAVKLIRAGMDTRSVVARFEAERQALALMDHSTIAKVFDAGATPGGLPYFAMEYVDGEPITTFCDRRRLDLRERLALFTQVCDGVQHAHRKGIIHRDLKPSNVLVTTEGERPVPKIIDFGVAKAMGPNLGLQPGTTELGVLLGTPEYMSPEQAAGAGSDVDTRTDVYALGVMLYEMLAGRLPFEPRELRDSGYEEMLRRIRHVEPPRPSARIRALGGLAAGAAENRGTDPARLSTRLSGDLDWIVMKAIEKDRNRRYGSAEELAADLGRYLRHEPVIARPLGLAYRAARFSRRHRFGVAVSTVAVMALVAVVFATLLQARRVADQRDRADREARVSRRVTEFLVQLFQVSDPDEARGNDITAREILDRGSTEIEKALDQDPLVQARLMLAMGTVYRNLGLYPQAEPILQRAVEIHRRLLGDEAPATLTSVHALYELQFAIGRYDEAAPLIERTYEVRRRLLGEEHPDTLRSAYYLAADAQRRGRYFEAAALDTRILETRRRVLGADHPDTLLTLRDLAEIDLVLGRPSDAETRLREVLEHRRRGGGPWDQRTLDIQNELAAALFFTGRYDESEALAREELEASERIFGPEHYMTLQAIQAVARPCIVKGRFAEAEMLDRRAFETSRRVFGETHQQTTNILFDLGHLELYRGHNDAAETIFRRVVDQFGQTLGEDHPMTLYCLDRLAVALHDNGRDEEAEPLLLRVLAKRRQALGEDSPYTLATLTHLADVVASRGRGADAETLYREVLDDRHRSAMDSLPIMDQAAAGLARVQAVTDGRATDAGSTRSAPASPPGAGG